jgi:drug/metabolite transporter (DMT)-like permease
MVGPVTRRGWFLFLFMGIIWGLPYLLIKVAVGDLPTAVVVFSRVALATVILLPIALATGQFKQLRGHWRWVLAFAVAEMTLPWWALTWAEQYITSSMAGLFIATVPLVTALIARRMGLDDRLTGSRLAGMGIGLVGVVALVGLDVSGSSLLAVAVLLVTVVGYSCGPIIIDKKLNNVPGLAVISAALAINAIVYAPFAALTWPREPIPTDAVWAVVILGSLCTAIAFLGFFALVKEVGPSRSTLITYINPAVAVILGIWVLSEPLTLGLAIGFPLVLLGSWLATRRAPALESEPHA